jgi:hypothetical protein
MGRKILVTESQLRYIIENIGRIDEQVSQSASNGLSMQEIQKIVATDSTNKGDLNTAQRLGQCVFIKSPKKETVTLDGYRINAQFYNNMVSLQRGLMPETPVSKIQEGIKNIIFDLKDNNLQNIEIEIIGTATSQYASMKPDKRLLDKDSNAKLDHPGGKPYNGGDPNNDYLAKQRANSILQVFKTLLPQAKFKVSSKVIEGGSMDDALRYVQLKIKGERTTDVFTTISDLWMNWEVSYEPVSNATTKGQRSDYVGGGSQSGYKAYLKIEYGQKSYPQFNGKVYFESADKQNASGQNILSDPKRSTKLTYPFLLKGAGTTPSPNFSTFLASSGYFPTATAYDIGESSTNKIQNRKNSIYRVDSEIFKKMANQKKGNLQDFIRLAGGSETQIIDVAHAKFAYVYDITQKPPTLQKIS